MMLVAAKRSIILAGVISLVGCAPKMADDVEETVVEGSPEVEPRVNEEARPAQTSTSARVVPVHDSSLARLSASESPTTAVSAREAAVTRGLEEARSSLRDTLLYCGAELRQYDLPVAIRARVRPSREAGGGVVDYETLAGAPFREDGGRLARCLEEKIGQLRVELPGTMQEVNAEGVEVLSLSEEGMAVEFRFNQAELLKPQ